MLVTLILTVLIAFVVMDYTALRTKIEEKAAFTIAVIFAALIWFLKVNGF